MSNTKQAMPDQDQVTKPVEDNVPQVENAVAVGEDLAFQRRWWRFENVAWWVFGAILLADALGAFGRGYLAKASRQTPDGTMSLQYERVERANTPSVMTIRFGPRAIANGAIRLHVSATLLQELGAQRVIPQPAFSTVDDDGVTYMFPVSAARGVVEIALEPSFPGVHRFTMGIAGADAVSEKIAVVP